MQSKRQWTHSDAYLAIQSWNPNQDWQLFARVFSSQRVINEKPMGVYVQPLFTGNNAKGH